jgi:hypothetical protein
MTSVNLGIAVREKYLGSHSIANFVERSEETPHGSLLDLVLDEIFELLDREGICKKWFHGVFVFDEKSFEDNAVGGPGYDPINSSEQTQLDDVFRVKTVRLLK